MDRIKRLPAGVRNALIRKMAMLTGDLRNYVITDKLSGQVLNKQSGALQQSIQRDVASDDQSVTGRVFSAKGTSMGGTPVENYAGAQEYGAHIPERVPVKALALSWIANGKRIFAMRAAAFNLPERSYLRSSLSDKATDIGTGIKDAVAEGIEESA